MARRSGHYGMAFPVLTPVFFGLVLFLAASPALATNGLNLMGFGARSVGLAGAFTAVADDTNSINSNPAGLTQITRRELQLNLDVGTATIEHRDMFGGESPGEQNFSFLPSVGYAQKLKSIPLAFGLAAFVQGGVGAEYEDIPTAFGALLPNPKTDDLFIDLIYARIAPAVAYQLSPKLSIGAALFIGYARLNIELFPNTSAPPGTPGAPAGFFGLDLDGAEAWGLGGRFGILYKATDWLSLGAQYATSSTLAFRNGDLTLDMTSIGLGKVKYEAEVDSFAWPQEFSVGMALRPIKQLLASFDVKWINWNDALNTAVIRGRNPNIPVPAPLASQDIPVRLDWKDQVVFAVGIAYNLTEAFVIRAGYNRGDNPIPEETLNPLIATIIEDHVTVGLGYTFGKLSLHLAYLRGFTNKVTYTNPDLPFGPNASEEASIDAGEVMIRYEF